MPPLYLAMPGKVTHDVIADAKQVCQNRKSWIETITMVPHSHKGLLHDIMCCICIADSEQGAAKDDGLVLFEQQAKRLSIGGMNLPDKLFVCSHAEDWRFS